MIEIYKALRDQDCGRFAAFKETVQMIWALRQGCIEGIHVTLDVWDDRCWHERINDKIERLESQRVWGNPDITWGTDDLAEPTWGWQEDGSYIPSPILRGWQEDQGVDYHPWRQ